MSPRTKEQFEEIRELSTTKILDAALELFAEEGYDRTSINKIAQKAGVSKGLIYNYYDSKEELLKALLASMMEDFDASIITNKLENGQPLDALRAVVDFIFDFIEKHPKKMMLTTKLSLQVAQFDFLQEMIKGKSDFYFGLSEELFTQLGYKEPKSEAYIISLIFDGLALQALSLKEKFWLKECKKAIYRKYNLL